MPEFGPVDRDKLITALEDHDPVPFFNGKTFGWDIVPRRTFAGVTGILPSPDPNITTVRFYWKTHLGRLTSPLVIGRIEVFAKDISFYFEEAQMSMGERMVRLQGTFNEKMLEAEVTADGRVRIEEIDQLNGSTPNADSST